MKKTLFIISFFAIVGSSSAQFIWHINFDDNICSEHVFIDTVSNPNCAWQIGQPDKTVFDSAFSLPNAIVTDTINPVPKNDTSTFLFWHERDNWSPWHFFVLRFWFKMDGSENDFGTIEISPNNKTNWINVLTEDSTYSLEWWSPKPTLKGTTEGWQHFNLDLSDWASGGGIFPIPMTADTIWFRFTYITDSLSTPSDGWMMDSFELEDWWESIAENEKKDLFSIYPNPASDKIKIELNQNATLHNIQIFNISGGILYQASANKALSIDVKQFNNGIYLLKYSNGKNFSTKRFVVCR
jgi:Secretion system C-terminal sorting domain